MDLVCSHASVAFASRLVTAAAIQKVADSLDSDCNFLSDKLPAVAHQAAMEAAADVDVVLVPISLAAVVAADVAWAENTARVALPRWLVLSDLDVILTVARFHIRLANRKVVLAKPQLTLTPTTRLVVHAIS